MNEMKYLITILILFVIGPRPDVSFARTLIVNKNASAKDIFHSISEAAERAQPGDTILVYGGVYRERVTPPRGGQPNNPITYLAAPNQTVVIKGSDIWLPNWHSLTDSPHVYYAKLDSSHVQGYHPYHMELHHKRPDSSRLTLGQIFVDGALLNEVSTVEHVRKNRGTWTHDLHSNCIYVNFPERKSPASQIELTTRGRIFAPHKRGLGYIHIQGFIMEHCANQFPAGFWASKERAQAGAFGCRSGHHWVIENNVIRFAKTIGLDIGSESEFDIEGEQPTPSRDEVGHHLIRNNVISDNGACGIAGWAHTGTRIIGNTLERNNRLGFLGWETAGIKVHGFIDGRIEGNIIRDNESFGIWIDNVWRGSRITRNVVVNNLWAGIFVEMGEGPVLVDNNIVAYTRAGVEMGTRGGHGFYAHDASGVTIAHNLLYCNANFGVWMHIATDRQYRTESGERKLVEASHERILNNLIIGNKGGAISFPFPFERSTHNISNGNLISSGGLSNSPLFVANTAGGRIKINILAGAFQDSLESHQTDTTLHPNYELWKTNPCLTFKQWQLLTDQDLHSTVFENKHSTFRSRLLEFELEFGKGVKDIKCVNLPGIEQDFFQNPMPAHTRMPGPFQNIRKGTNWLLVKPLIQ